MNNDTYFFNFIQEIRKKQNLSIKQLCDGLCGQDTIDALESGKWTPDKLLQDFLLDRLGIGAEDYEHLLFSSDYKRWMDRQRILHHITYEDIRRAGKLLARYLTNYDMKSPLEKQFYLSMRAQIRRMRDGGRAQLFALFAEAAALTIPASAQISLGNLILSAQELNLLLEAEHYRPEGERIHRYLEIHEYIIKRDMDRWSLTKIYPKAVYFLCRFALSEQSPACEPQMLLKYCHQAIELLRDNERMYFLWELLTIQEQLVHILTRQLLQDGESIKAEGVEKIFHENLEWKLQLECIYKEYKVPKETFEYCYLYVQKGVSCINDIIRIRRQMLGMNRRKLCEGICDEKTLGRLERKQTKSQRAIVEALLEKLGIPADFTRTELVTASQEARELMTKLRIYSNQKQWDKVERLQKEIKALVPMNIRYNQQAIMNKEILVQRKKDQLSNDAYLHQMKEVLELTLPFEAFIKDGPKYLTHEEQICIQNMMTYMEQNSPEFQTCIQRFTELYSPFLENGLLETVTNIYELVMGNIESVWGNQNKYDQSDRYIEVLLIGCLRFRRPGALHAFLYDRWWNHDQRKQKGMSTTKILNDMEELKKCILFSKLTKSKNDLLFYQKHLNKLRCQPGINVINP